jgi:hypothetical protein
MNTRILLLALSVAALSSCSSVYKSGQTPDDVYYSPAPVRVQADEYVDVKQPKQGTNYQSYEQYAESQRDDRFLRMSVGNPYYMNAYNSYGGFDWRYNSFYDGFNLPGIIFITHIHLACTWDMAAIMAGVIMVVATMVVAMAAVIMAAAG